MKNFISTVMVIIAIAFSSLTKAQISPNLSARFQFVLDSVCNRYQIKGTSAAVLIPGIGVWKGANGYSTSGVAIKTDMLLGMGSNTKTLMATVLLKMQEQQLISLDDTIGKWISGYPNINGKITIQQCLNHTSGLFDYMQNESINDSIFDNPQKLWTKEEILRLAKAPYSTPGANWNYSNTNYIIAGIIIEKVLKKSAFEALKELIYSPAGLTQTFNYGEEGNALKANPWSLAMNGNTMVDMTTTPFLRNLFSLANTAGSLITTAEDNVIFWHKLFTKQLINENSWRQMTKMQSIGSNIGYGLGIFRYARAMNGRTFYAHGGTFFGYINENMVDTTSGVVIAVLTNQDSMNNDGLKNTIIRALHKVTLNLPTLGYLETSVGHPNIKIFPNPATNWIQIESSTEVGSIMFTDMSGKILANETVQNFLCNTQFLETGMYFAYLKNNQNEIIGIEKVQILR